MSGPSVTPVFGGSGAPTGMFLITGSGMRFALFALFIVPTLIGPSIVALFPGIETPEPGCVQSEPWKVWLLSCMVNVLVAEPSAARVSIELFPLVPCHAVSDVLHGLVAQSVVVFPTIVIPP